MPRNKDITVPELARVRETEVSHMKRGFYATLADQSVCYVTCWTEGDNHLFCHRHGNGDCEGAFRVKLVLMDEWYQSELKEGLLTLTGFQLRGDGKREGPIISRAHLKLG